MLTLVRLYAKRNPDAVWDYVQRIYEARSSNVMPLFMSQPKWKRFVTVIFETKTLDDLQSLIVDQSAKCPDISDTQTIPLMKPVFLPIPRERPSDLGRYSVTVKAHPTGYRAVYESIINTKHEANLFVWYAAYALGEYDVFCSVFAKGKRDIDQFSGSLRKIAGVTKVTPLSLKRTQIIASDEEWNRLRVRLLYRPSWLTEEFEQKMTMDHDLSVAQYSSMG